MFKERLKELGSLALAFLIGAAIAVACGTACMYLIKGAIWLFGESPVKITAQWVVGIAIGIVFLILVGAMLYEIYKQLKVFIMWLFIEPYREHKKERASK